jgi:hypothetical protein
MGNMKIKKKKYSLKQKINLNTKNNQNNEITIIFKTQNSNKMMKVWEFLANNLIKITKNLTSGIEI